MRAPSVSEQGKEVAAAAAPGPAHAGAGEKWRKRARLVGPTAMEGKSRPTWVGFQAVGCTGKFFFFYICFPNHLNRFSNPNQIKSKPHHTVKQMQQYECIIKYST
jgi:hypothetical protein